LLAAAQAAEHYEISRCGTLKSWASYVRIAKSSKEQDEYEAPDTTGARLSPGPEGARYHRLVTKIWFQE
jgi:hypothetical protein